MKSSVLDFLNKYGLNPDLIDMQAATDEFVRQMESGNSGDIKSLLMIPTYIGVQSEVPKNEPIIVMDAGGTNFRIATVIFDNSGKPVIENFSKQPMPGTQGELTSDEFFDTLASLIKPFDKISNKVGFCFSFPTEILPNCDGRLINFNKEVKVKDVAGKVIGEGINNALKKMGCSEKHFVIINDTVATMLGAIAEYPDKAFDSYIGFILGTGTNTCYIEQCENISKLEVKNTGAMAVNIETGSFDGFHRGEIDLRFDATTSNCGDHVFEKMISGAYQGSLICMTLKQAASDGLFSAKTAESLLSLDDLSMRQIDEFCENTNEGFIASLICNEDDRSTVFDIIDAAFERSAKTVCVNLGAVMLKTGRGKTKQVPICISAEGTTFYKSVLFRPKLDRYVAQFINEKLGLYCEFVSTQDSTLVGSAVAGLLN